MARAKTHLESIEDGRTEGAEHDAGADIFWSLMYFVLSHAEARRRALQAVSSAPEGHIVRITPPTRSLDQNARLWAMLGEVSRNVQWYGKKLTPEDWKHVFSASIRKLDVVPNLDGTGFVALGMSTSRMTKHELSDLMELIAAFCAERGIDSEAQSRDA